MLLSNLLVWTEEEAMKIGMPFLKKARLESVEDLSRTVVGLSSKAYKEFTSQLRLPATSSGE